MTISIEIGSGDFLGSKAEVLALIVTEGGFEKQRAFAHVDQALGGALKVHVGTQFKGRADEVLEVPTLGRLGARRLVLVGAGPKRGFDGTRLRAAAATATRAAVTAPSLALVAGELASSPEDVRCLSEGAGLGAYTFTKY